MYGQIDLLTAIVSTDVVVEKRRPSSDNRFKACGGLKIKYDMEALNINIRILY